MAQCIADSCFTNIRVTSTGEPYKAYGKTDPHTQGMAIDFTVDQNKKQCAMQAAADCGAPFQKDEYSDKSKGANGAHIHAQLRPGLGGKTGPYYTIPDILPTPRPTQAWDSDEEGE